MNNYYTYILIDPRNNQPFYVGKGNGYRMYEHIRNAKKEWQRYDNNLKLNKIRAIIKANLNIIYKKVIENVTEQEAIDKEIELIKFYGRLDLETGMLTNLTNGGDGASGYKHTQEWKDSRKNIPAWNKGKTNIYSEDTINNIKEKRKLQLIGPRSEETKRKISESQKGRDSSYIRWIKLYGEDEADRRLSIATSKQKYSLKKYFLNNKRKTLYQCWVDKYGKEIADIKEQERKEKISKSSSERKYPGRILSEDHKHHIGNSIRISEKYQAAIKNPERGNKISQAKKGCKSNYDRWLEKYGVDIANQKQSDLIIKRKLSLEQKGYKVSW